MDCKPCNTMTESKCFFSHLPHEYAVLISRVVQPHASVAIISFPEVHHIGLIVILTALKGQNATFAVLHLFLGECDNLSRHVLVLM